MQDASFAGLLTHIPFHDKVNVRESPAERKEAWNMTARELLNLIDWLRKQGFEDDKIIECLESVEGRK